MERAFFFIFIPRSLSDAGAVFVERPFCQLRAPVGVVYVLLYDLDTVGSDVNGCWDVRIDAVGWLIPDCLFFVF